MSETEPQFKGPAIAVVVPVHNGAAFLQQCLASLAAQTFGDFACFVVDDGSTDESAELAAAWESRDARFVVIHQRQSGVAAARDDDGFPLKEIPVANRAVRHAAPDKIFFVFDAGFSVVSADR